MGEPRFDYRKHDRKAARAANRGSSDGGFLHREAGTIIGERLAAIERKFTSPAILFDGIFADEIETSVFACNPPIHGHIKRIPKPDNDILGLEPQSIDLAISVFDLHRTNDLPSIMLQLNHALKPDGLFMAALPCEGSLLELREAILKAEIAESGGAGMRVDAFPHIRQLGDLLQKTGFKLTVADVETRTIRYGKFDRLIGDLRDTGAGNTNPGSIRYISKKCLENAKKIYQNDYADRDGKIPATINIACLSGWKEDASQQKPLKPGSAKHNLKDFI